jgi:hypothetical protein
MTYEEMKASLGDDWEIAADLKEHMSGALLTYEAAGKAYAFAIERVSRGMTFKLEDAERAARIVWFSGFKDPQ